MHAAGLHGVGVQYGLVALNSGQITAEQFVDLNEKLGGLDVEWNHQPARSVADAAAIQTMYRAGLVTYPREAAKVPIIDLRNSGNADVHTDFHSYAMRARLQKAAGSADNQVIWSIHPGWPANYRPSETSITLLDTWLSRIEADKSDRTVAQKVVANRPAQAVDACWIQDVKTTDMQKCRAAFPYFSDPRIAAGGPLADDIVKCTLEPLDRNDYGAEFTDAQWERLQKAFPDGVCDYSKPGQFQQPSIPWMSFADGPGGRPLGDPPRSTPLGGTVIVPACASAVGFRSVGATPRRGGLRFDVDRFQGRAFSVEVFQQSAGRRVVGDRLIARFRDRIEPLTWKGSRKLRDGHHFVRFTMRLDGGLRDVRRVALRRVRGRFRPAPAFYQRVDCGTFRTLKLSSAVFGGRTAVPLGIAVRLAERAERLVVQVRAGKRLVKEWRVRRPATGRTYRLRLPARSVATGRTVRVQVTAIVGGKRVRAQQLNARRL